MSRLGRLRFSALLLAVVAVLAAGCGEGEPQAVGDGPEKTDITLGMLPLPEVAPIQIGIDKGYFAAEGVTVRIELIQGGAAALPDLVSGKLDVLHSNYVSALLAAASGVAKLKVAGDAYVAQPGNYVLVSKKGSPVGKPVDLKGRKIGVNTLNNVATLAVSAMLKTAGLAPTDVEFVEQPFPQMAGALDSGIVDAAFLPEPFWQTAERQDGVHLLADMFAASTAGFPIAGYLVTEQFAQANPKTVAAFQRALRKAAEQAISDPAAAKSAMLRYTKIDKPTADLMKLGGYAVDVDRARLQRVADLMLEFGYLKKTFDVSSLLLTG